MGGNDEGSVFRNIPCGFFRPFLDNEATESPQVDILVSIQRVFYSFHKSFNCLLNSDFLNPGVL